MDWITDCFGLRIFQNNMEYTNKISKEKIQLIMVVGIWIACILLLIAIIVLVKNINEIESDTISYGIEKKDINICNCYSKTGTKYVYNATDPVQTINYGNKLSN